MNANKWLRQVTVHWQQIVGCSLSLICLYTESINVEHEYSIKPTAVMALYLQWSTYHNQRKGKLSIFHCYQQMSSGKTEYYDVATAWTIAFHTKIENRKLNISTMLWRKDRLGKYYLT